MRECGRTERNTVTSNIESLIEENIELKNNDDKDRTVRNELGNDVDKNNTKDDISQDLRRSDRIRKQQIPTLEKSTMQRHAFDLKHEQ